MMNLLQFLKDYNCFCIKNCATKCENKKYQIASVPENNSKSPSNRYRMLSNAFFFFFFQQKYRLFTAIRRMRRHNKLHARMAACVKRAWHLQA